MDNIILRGARAKAAKPMQAAALRGFCCIGQFANSPAIAYMDVGEGREQER
jgi:hypothetical protein